MQTPEIPLYPLCISSSNELISVSLSTFHSSSSFIKLFASTRYRLCSDRVLNDGAETFDEIRRALRQARESIHMEYYIIEDDELGREIADILIAKAAEGVEVRLIYDDVGELGARAQVSRAVAPGGRRGALLHAGRFPLAHEPCQLPQPPQDSGRRRQSRLYGRNQYRAALHYR